MEYTDVTLNCSAITTGPDTEEFRIEAVVDDAGELPTTAIFVFTIGAEDDVTTDSFARIANPQDLQNLLINRDDTIAIDGTEYLASSAEFLYEELNVAVDAKAMLKTRINELVKLWLTYENSFITESGESRPYPSSDPEVEETLKADYAAAKEARIAAGEDVTAADTALTTAETEVENALILINTYQSCYDFIVDFSEKFYDYVSAITTEGAAAAGIRTTSLSPLLSTRGAECSSQLQYWKNLKTAREDDVASATQDKIEAEQTYAAAQKAEDAALAAVLAVCPDFDPASV